jgi:nicotinate-nucleotide adenylyltransferase
MLTCAVKNEPALKVDDCEIQRQKPSYMIETLEAFREKLPSTPLCLILGVDAWLGFAEWHRYESILQISHLMIAQRPSYALPKTGKIAALLEQHFKQDVSALHRSLGGHIFFHTGLSLDISSTTIRHQIANHQNPRDLLPEGVYDYIAQQGIYR